MLWGQQDLGEPGLPSAVERRKAQKGGVDFSLTFDGQTEMCESSNKRRRVFLKGFVDSVVFGGGGQERLYVTIESAVI